MKVLLLASLLLLVSTIFLFSSQSENYSSILNIFEYQSNKNQAKTIAHSYQIFKEWKQKYNKYYQNNQVQEIYRYHIWLKNVVKIQKHNKMAQLGLVSYWMAANQFTDLSQNQWNQMYLQSHFDMKQNEYIHNQNSDICTGPQPSDKDLPQSIDWAAKSAVTGVKSQGTCSGAGYAFAAVQSIQSSRYVSTGKLVQLSPQHVIDCTDSYGNNGCISGNVSYAYQYLFKSGVASQRKYSYKGFHYTCAYNITQKQAQLMSCVKVTPQKQLSIKAAVRKQPVAVSINAAKIQHYSKGIFDSSSPLIQNCKTQHNHWMLLVGYGHDQKEKKSYWKLKNSWGSSWGISGYFYIVRKGDGEGDCGVQTQLYFPIAL